MKKLTRLAESSNSDAERLLLGVERERAPSGAKTRALAAATGVLAASTLAAGGIGGAGAAAAGKGAVGAKTASLVSAISLKWVVGIAVVVGVAGAGVGLGTIAVHAGVAGRGAPPSVAPDPAHAVTRPGKPSALPPAVPSVPAAPETAVGGSAPTVPVEDLRAVVPAIAPSASAGSTSAAELALLDQARGVLADGEPARALSILDAYRARFPRGVMTPEASVLRIEALVKAGDRPAAKRVADAFLKSDPASPYAARIESLLAASNP